MKAISRTIITALCILLFLFCVPAEQANAASGTAVNVKVGSKTFPCVFYNNATAKALLKSMPVKYKMSELNGNEKYKYLSRDLPMNEKKVKKIKAGDVMLYGSDCLVVFYKSFTTSYEYTPIGHITKTKGLQKAAGKGSVTIRFSKKKVIGLSRKSLTLNPGKTKTIKLTGAKAKKVKWSSSNRKVATVVKGKIKARKVGKATITAKYKGKKYKCKVIVKAVQKPAEPIPDPHPITPPETDSDPTTPPATDPDPTTPPATDPDPTEPGTDQPTAEKKLTLKIGDKPVDVDWAENESVAALQALVKDQPLTIQMSMYGGFEQVGSLGTSLPRNDVQTTTSAGDIVLYSGNQIVVFYGSNSWSYTRLGHITDQNADEMKNLLSNGNVTMTISME